MPGDNLAVAPVWLRRGGAKGLLLGQSSSHEGHIKWPSARAELAINLMPRPAGATRELSQRYRARHPKKSVQQNGNARKVEFISRRCRQVPWEAACIFPNIQQTRWAVYAFKAPLLPTSAGSKHPDANKTASRRGNMRSALYRCSKNNRVCSFKRLVAASA